jgi:hypothetical protein
MFGTPHMRVVNELAGCIKLIAQRHPFRVVVDGRTAAGKTTLLIHWRQPYRSADARRYAPPSTAFTDPRPNAMRAAVTQLKAITSTRVTCQL